MKLHRPVLLAAIMALVLEFADTQANRATHQPAGSGNRRPWQNREGRGRHGDRTAGGPGTFWSRSPVGAGGRTVEQAKPLLIRVSYAEKAERSRQGLCYHCPEKWVIEHVRKQRILCYTDGEDDFEEEGFGRTRKC